jgi:hypothetical protein
MAGRLFDRLEGAEQVPDVFIDVDRIAAGEDFVDRMLAATQLSEIVLVLIGSAWRGDGVTDRLARADDAVRLENEAALAQGKRIIPVLVDDAPMPAKTDWPRSIQRLATLNALALRHATFSADLRTLFQALGLKTDAARSHTFCTARNCTLGALLGLAGFAILALVNKAVASQSLQLTLGSPDAVWMLLATMLTGGGVCGRLYARRR